MQKNTAATVRALQRAIKAAGGQAKLARQLNLTRQSIQGWHRIPIDRVVDVERCTGIPRDELRPDVFGAV